MFSSAASTSAFRIAFALLLSWGLENAQAVSEPEPPKSAYPIQVIKSPNDNRDYRVLTLENQLDVILVHDPDAKKAAAAMAVDVGALQDPESQLGLAHYLEHMLFLGTKKYPKVNDYQDFLTKNGGTSNAYTNLTLTNYMVQVDVNAFEETVDRFSDFFKSPLFLPEFSDKERSAVNAEWTLRRESDASGMFSLRRLLFGDHPANKFFVGNLETLSDKPNSKLLTEMKQFYDRYYSANRMKGVLISNLSLSEMEKLAREYFSGIENKNIASPKITKTIEQKHRGMQYIHYLPNKDLKAMRFEFLITNNQEQWALKPNSFLSYLINSEMTGSAAEQLKAKGLITYLGTSVDSNSFGNYGLFAIRVGLTDEGLKREDEITATVLQYVEKVKNSGVDKKYFEEIKRSMQNSFRFLEKYNPFNYAANLAAKMHIYPIENVISGPFTFERFDKASIDAVAKQLVPENLKIWSINRNVKTDQSLEYFEGQYQVSEITAKQIKAWQTTEIAGLKLPRINTLFPEAFDIVSLKSAARGKPTVVVDTPGFEATVINSEFFPDVPKGILYFHINNPDIFRIPKNQLSFIILQRWLALKSSELSNEAGYAGNSTNFLGQTGLTFFLGGYTDKQLLILEKMMQKLFLPIEDSEFENIRKDVLLGYQNSQRNRGIDQLSPNFNRLTTIDRLEIETMIALTEKLSKKDIEAIRSMLLEANTIRVFGFGNYNEASITAIQKLAEKMLPKRKKVTQYTKIKRVKPVKGHSYIYRKTIPLADSAILSALFHTAPGYRSNAAARLLATHLHSKFYDQLRTKEQLAYALGATSLGIEDYSGIGFFIQSPIKSVKDLQNRVNDYFVEYKKELDAMTLTDFISMKKSLVTSFTKKPDNLSSEMNRYFESWDEQKPYDQRDKLIKAIQATSLSDIRRFYDDLAKAGNPFQLKVHLTGQSHKDEEAYSEPGMVIVEDIPGYQQSQKQQ